jgi:hypothetical protein
VAARYNSSLSLKGHAVITMTVTVLLTLLASTLLIALSSQIGQELGCTALTLGILLLCVQAARVPVRSATILNMGLVFATFVIAYMVLPALFLIWHRGFDPAFAPSAIGGPENIRWALIYVLACCYAFALAYMMSYGDRLPSARNPAATAITRPSAQMGWVIVLLLIVGLAGKVLLLQATAGGGLGALASKLSPGQRQDARDAINPIVSLLSSCFDWGILALVWREFALSRCGEKKIRWLLVGSLLVITTVAVYLTSGKRSTALPLLFIPFIWHAQMFNKASMRRLSAAAVVFIALSVGLVAVRIILPNYLRGYEISDYIGGKNSEALDFYYETTEFSVFELVLSSLFDADSLLKLMVSPWQKLFTYTFGTFIFPIPRAIWPDKPDLEDLSMVELQYLFGFQTGGGIAASLFGALPLWFGPVLSALGFALLGMLAARHENSARRSPRSLAVFWSPIALWMFFQFLRFGTVGFTALLFAQTLLPSFLVALFLQRRADRIAAA